MKMFPSTGFILLVTLLPFTAQLSVKEYLTLNKEQKLKLDQFRSIVSDKVPHDYMKKDVYLIRWLRDQDFDLQRAEDRLMGHIKWREDNKMDTILDEDWSDFDSEYRLNVEGCDKDGKPVMSVIVGDWDIRRGILTGKFERMSRYFDKLLEEAVLLVRRMQDDGQPVTQGTFIFDMGNFNLITQGCPRCIAIYIRILTNVEDHFPGFAHKVIAVNVPEITLPIYQVYKPLINKQIRDVLHIFGRNKEEWSRLLLKEIEPDQLSVAFGGRNEEGLDYNDFRTSLNYTVPNCGLLKEALMENQKNRIW